MISVMGALCIGAAALAGALFAGLISFLGTF
jgi:hypothetical protein